MEFVNMAFSKWIICRICFKNLSGEKMAQIDLQFVMKIEEIFGIELDMSPGLPDSICNKCFTLFRATSKFREKIKRSQAEMEKFVNENCASFNNNINFEEQEELSNLPRVNECERKEPEEVRSGDLLATDNIDSNDEQFFYAVEYQSADPVVIQDNTSSEIDDKHFEVLKNNEKLVELVNNAHLDELGLVLESSEGFERENGSFKLVQMGHASNITIHPDEVTLTSCNKPKKSLSSVKQRRRKASLDTDQRSKNNETCHICPYCGNNYTEKSKLSLHMKIHTKEKPHQCEICLKRFGQTPQLARHMNSHTGSRPFHCKYCSASFADPSTKIKHERIHTNERPYKCSYCDKAFSYSNVLKVHIMTHTGEKPYHCKYCRKQFSQSHHKNKHERLHESADLKSKKKNEGFQDIS